VATDGTSTAGAYVAKSANTLPAGGLTFAGISSASVVTRVATGTYRYKQGVKVQWNVASDTSVVEYYIYSSTTSGGQDFDDACSDECADVKDVSWSIPACCYVSDRQSTYFTFYGYEIATNYFFAVRASDGTLTDQNLVEEYALTTSTIDGAEMDIDGDGLLPYPYGPDCENDGDGKIAYLCGGNDYNDVDAGSYSSGASGTYSYTGEFSNDGDGGAGATYDLTAGDFNGDGYLDLATPNWSKTVDLAVDEYFSEIVTLLNDGDATFDTTTYTYATTQDTTTKGPYRITTADFNGDLCLDIVAPFYNGSKISFLKGNCDGTHEDYSYTTEDVSNPWDAAPLDVDNDGDFDLVVSSYGDDGVKIFLNDGEANFTYSTIFSTGANTRDVFAADVNNDGYLDILAAVWAGAKFSVYINNGDGTFAAADEYAVTSTPSGIFAVDLDGDSWLDIIVTDPGADTIQTYINDGDGTFTASQSIAQIWDPTNLFPYDIDGDGDMDLYVMSAGGVRYYRYDNNGSGTLAYVGYGTLTSAAAGIYIGYFTDDGVMDVSIGATGKTIKVWTGN